MSQINSQCGAVAPPAIKMIAVSAFVIATVIAMLTLWAADHFVLAWWLGAAAVGVVSWAWKDDTNDNPPQS